MRHLYLCYFVVCSFFTPPESLSQTGVQTGWRILRCARRGVPGHQVRSQFTFCCSLRLPLCFRFWKKTHCSSYISSWCFFLGRHGAWGLEELAYAGRNLITKGIHEALSFVGTSSRSGSRFRRKRLDCSTRRRQRRDSFAYSPVSLCYYPRFNSAPSYVCSPSRWLLALASSLFARFAREIHYHYCASCSLPLCLHLIVVIICRFGILNETLPLDPFFHSCACRLPLLVRVAFVCLSLRSLNQQPVVNMRS